MQTLDLVKSTSQPALYERLNTAKASTIRKDFTTSIMTSTSVMSMPNKLVLLTEID